MKDENQCISTNQLKTHYPYTLKLWLMYCFQYHLSNYDNKNALKKVEFHFNNFTYYMLWCQTVFINVTFCQLDTFSSSKFQKQ